MGLWQLLHKNGEFFMNKKSRYKKHKLSLGLASSLSVLMGALASQALAQEARTADEAAAERLEEEVVVVGTRLNLQNAQDIKRDADTFVDAISADDIGSLPDRSVLEAIQRLPGVSIERFSGPDDPDHFSVEGSGAIIRGMTQTRSEFNGRDSFTASSSRGLNFQDVPPELMGGVDIYKNQTADLIEGGIGGTISLRTRKPFDQGGRQSAFTVDYSYGDLAKDWSPSVSGLFSDRWDTGIGEFGVLISGAYSQLYGESHGIQSDAYSNYYAALVPGTPEHAQGLANDDNAIVWMPNSANVTMKEDDRNRKGASVVVQWANPADTLTVTGEYIRSDSTLDWYENAVKYQGGYQTSRSNLRSTAYPGTEIEFDDQNRFVSGTWDFVAFGDRGSNNSNVGRIPGEFVEIDGEEVYAAFGPKVQPDTRVQLANSLVEDFSINFGWQATDNLELSLDYQFIKAESRVDDLQLMMGTHAGQSYDVSGSTPNLTFVDPWYGLRDDNRDAFIQSIEEVRQEQGDLFQMRSATIPGFSDDPAGDSNYFQDPNSYWWRSTMDHYERSKGESEAVRLDGTLHLDDGFFTAIRAGVRFADREQLVNRSGYRWVSTAPEWSYGSPAGWLGDADYESQYGDWEYVDWNNFHRGGVFNVAGDGRMIHPTADYAKALMGRLEERARDIVVSPAGNWDTNATAHRDDLDSEYGLFTPGERNYTREQNQAIYLRLDFGGDMLGKRYTGNVGVRYARLTREATGAVVFADKTAEDHPPESYGETPLTGERNMAYIEQLIADGIAYDVATARRYLPWLDEDVNYLPRDDVAFLNGQELPLTAKTTTDLVLPSFNIKFEITDDLIGRFAIARAAAYPDLSEVRNNLSVGILNYNPAKEYVDVPEDNPYANMIDSAYVQGWTGSGGNPYLKPMISDQADISLEWYFADIGQLTGTLFYKQLGNYFIKGSNYQQVTNTTSGVSRLVDVDSTINGTDADMSGFELSYQQFYSGIFENFGTQITYTYIDAGGVPNNRIDYGDEVDNVNNDDDPDNDIDQFNDTGIRVTLDRVPLQGQSEHTVNLVGMYEVDKWSARLAYNWRSKYMLTTRDVISKAPLWFDDRGQLDGSVFYNVTDSVQVGLQGTNLLDTQSKTIMQLNNDGLQAGRSWFIQDRRIALVVKGQF